MSRRFIIATAMALTFGLSSFLTILPAAAQATEFGEKSKIFVQTLADQAILMLGDDTMDPHEREVRFRKLLVDNFDVPAIGRWVIGRYWRKATKAEKVEFQALFEDFIVITYARRFGGYTGEKLKVVQAITQNGADALVRSEINRLGDQAPIRVDWRLRSTNSQIKVVDLVIEGVSMSQTQRSEFGSVIKRNGGKIAGLIAALRKKTDELAANGVK